MPDNPDFYASDAQNVAAVDALAKQRAVSNYYFIGVNLVILMFAVVICFWSLESPVESSLRLLGLGANCMLSIIGFGICIYWLYEQREWMILERTRYLALMDSERIYTNSGTLSKIWDRLGDRPGRSSAVFFVPFAMILPTMLMSAQIVPAMAIFYLNERDMAHQHAVMMPRPAAISNSPSLVVRPAGQ